MNKFFLFFVFLAISNYYIDAYDVDFFGQNKTKQSFDKLDLDGKFLTSLASYKSHIYIGGDFSKTIKTSTGDVVDHLHHVVDFDSVTETYSKLGLSDTNVPSTVRCMGVSQTQQMLFIGGDAYKKSHQSKKPLVARISLKNDPLHNNHKDWIFFGPDKKNLSSSVPFMTKKNKIDDDQNTVRAMFLDESQLLLYVAYANQIFAASYSTFSNFVWKAVAPLPTNSKFIDSFTIFNKNFIIASYVTKKHYSDGLAEDFHVSFGYYKMSASEIEKFNAPDSTNQKNLLKLFSSNKNELNSALQNSDNKFISQFFGGTGFSSYDSINNNNNGDDEENKMKGSELSSSQYQSFLNQQTTLKNSHHDSSSSSNENTIFKHGINGDISLRDYDVNGTAFFDWPEVGIPHDFTSVSQITLYGDQLVVAGWDDGKTLIYAAKISQNTTSPEKLNFDWRLLLKASSDWKDFGDYTAPVFSLDPSDENNLIIGGFFKVKKAGTFQNETVSALGMLKNWRDPSFNNNKTYLHSFSNKFNKKFKDYRINAILTTTYNRELYFTGMDMDRPERKIGTGDYIMLVFIICYGFIAIIGLLFMLFQCNKEGCCFKCFKCGSAPSEDFTHSIFDEDGPIDSDD